MRVSLRQLETFRTFSGTLSVTETARLLHVSQSAVSHTLHQLELEVGVKLFFRSGNRLRLTTEGKQLLPAMERVFTQISQFEGEAEAARNLGGGHLTIASIQSIGQWLLNDAIGRFLVDRPRLRFTMNAFNAAEVLDQVRNESADMGFTMVGNDDAGIFLEPLLRSEVICVLPASHALASREAVTAADLHRERLILPASFTVVGTALTNIFPVDRMRRPDLLQITQSAMAVDLVARGLGVSLIHPFGMPMGAKDVVFRRFLPATELRLMMVFSRNRPVSKLVTSFVRDIRAVARETVEQVASTGLRMTME